MKNLTSTTYKSTIERNTLMKTNNVDYGKSFKFKYKGRDKIFTCHAVDAEGLCTISWVEGSGDEPSTTYYYANSIAAFIKDGDWIVLPSESTDYTRECIDKLNAWTGCMSYNDSYVGEPAGMLKSTIRQLDKTYRGSSHNTEKTAENNNFLDTIKAFTASSNHSVFIYEGKFEVYQAGLTEYPYKCKDDEQLITVMNALTVLDKVLSND